MDGWWLPTPDTLVKGRIVGEAVATGDFVQRMIKDAIMREFGAGALGPECVGEYTIISKCLGPLRMATLLN